MAVLTQNLSEKTRVLIVSTESVIHRFISELLTYVDAEFIEEDNTTSIQSDFAVLQTADLETISSFKPNIAIISSAIAITDITDVSKTLTAGGILIYPEKAEKLVEESELFFRKLTYTEDAVRKEGSYFLIETDLGDCPIQVTDQNFHRQISGLKILAQQLGISEEIFIETLLGFA